MTANKIKDRIGRTDDTDIREEVMALCELVGQLEARIERAERAARHAANIVSCLANGIVPY